MSALFDSQKFLHSLANDQELARELLDAFLEDSPIRSTSLGDALKDDDASTASKLAHSLKGMCGVVRTDSLVNLALLMENSAKNGELDKTRDQYAEFSQQLTSAHSEIHKFLAAM